MRLYRVDSVWRDRDDGRDHNGDVIDWRERGLLVTVGEEGPGVYMRDVMVPVEPMLADVFKGGHVASMRLHASQVDTDPSKPLMLRRDTRSNRDRVEQGNYYGSCLVHVTFREGEHEFMSSCFGEKLVKGHFSPRVVREFLPFRDSEGVEALAMSSDKQEALIHMMPASSFRLHRKVRGKNSVVVISWSGRLLRSTLPGYQKSTAPKPQQGKGHPTAHAPRERHHQQLSAPLADVVSLARRRQG